MQSVVAIGAFDGVHLGHQAVFNTVKSILESSETKKIGIALCVDATKTHSKSETHPQGETYSQGEAYSQITGIKSRIDLIKSYGIDKVILIEPSNKSFFNLSASEFIEQYLQKKLHTTDVVLGYNAHFGKNRIGSASFLEQNYSDSIKVHKVEQVFLEDRECSNPGDNFCKKLTISSSEIRKKISESNFQVANKMLGRPHFISGKVVHGLKNGQKLGFPTANLSIPSIQGFLPKSGVYAGRVKEYGLPAAISIGKNISFNKTEISVEAHIIGPENYNLYGKNITLDFFKKLRDMKKFETINLLIEQIKLDVQKTNEVFAKFSQI